MPRLLLPALVALVALCGLWCPCSARPVLWPWPQQIAWEWTSVQLYPASFQFSIAGPSNPILINATLRYEQLIFNNKSVTAHRLSQAQDSARSPAMTTLDSIAITMSSDDMTLQLGTDESYELSVTAPSAGLKCATVYGCLRGLETFAQLVQVVPGASSNSFYIDETPITIVDAPRFPHRGLLIDSSRHFLPLSTVYRTLDAMSYTKLNTLHWHLIDAQSFPVQSQVYPNLTLGAWTPEETYSLDDLRSVVEYAQYRGIRVVPEFDTPGHAYIWGDAFPAIMGCEVFHNNINNPALDPTNDLTYTVVGNFLGEMAQIFPDNYMHLGGDEVLTQGCWGRKQSILDWMDQQGIPQTDAGFRKLARIYISKLQQIVKGLGKQPIHWQEVFDHYGPGSVFPTPPPADPPLLSDTVIDLWYYPGWNWANMTDVTNYGLHAIKSDSWYLDGHPTWQSMYTADPFTNGTCNYTSWQCECSPCYNVTDPAKQALILGGEASMWGEEIDDSNIDQTVWPFTAATAERLWSAQTVNDPNEASPRIYWFRCLLKKRNIGSAPLGPGHC